MIDSNIYYIIVDSIRNYMIVNKVIKNRNNIILCHRIKKERLMF